MVEKEFLNLGRGAAVVRLKLKDLKRGHLLRVVLKTDATVEEINVEHRSAQFLYAEEQEYVFIDPHSYEQYQVDTGVVKPYQGLIKEGTQYRLVLYQNEVIDLQLPKKIVCRVVKTEKGVKGDTVTGATKRAELETGLVIKVPLFVREGDQVVVNTETKEYISRKND